ncbi:MAG: YggS family pyridoxal phosphate-dependent enzyme [Acidobacteriota bacterium]
MRNSDIARNLAGLQEAIQARAIASSRDPSEIQLLAVSKTFPPDTVVQACQAGQRSFGENRIQEAEKKIPQLNELQIEWHLIGHLQSNKARKAVELFDVIQTVDSEKIARRIGRMAEEMGKVQKVHLQVNIAEEQQKFGILPQQAERLCQVIDSLPGLDLLGLMAIPPYHEDPERSRPHFRRLAQLLSSLNSQRSQPLCGLSMGMSHDFEVAIEEVASFLRVGTALFGPLGL